MTCVAGCCVYHRSVSEIVSHAGTSHDNRSARVQRLRWLAQLFDNAFTIPGTSWRIGLDPILGLVPGLGDGVTAAFSLYIVIEAQRLGVPRNAVLRMLGNVAIDFLIGAVPVLGDIFDGVWKCNLRNLRIIETSLAGRV